MKISKSSALMNEIVHPKAIKIKAVIIMVYEIEWNAKYATTNIIN